MFAFFDKEGNLIESRQHPDPGTCEYLEDYATWLTDKFGYQPGVIWMREFQTPYGLGIHSLPSSGWPEDAWGWFHDKKYEINWCNTPWAEGRTGWITDT